METRPARRRRGRRPGRLRRRRDAAPSSPSRAATPRPLRAPARAPSRRPRRPGYIGATPGHRRRRSTIEVARAAGRASSSARRPSCCGPSRTSAPSPTSGRRTRPLKGLWGEPTVVNNVETLAAVPWIVANGAGAFAAIGDADAPGTTLVQVTGAVEQAGHRRGAHWARRCATCSTVGGGAKGTLKAVLVGGPAGGFLPADALDTPLTPARSPRRARIVGSGTIAGRRPDDLHRRAGHAPDALPDRRGVRQDHPLPHRHAPPGRAGRAASHRPARGPTDAAARWPTSRRTSATARCAAWSHGASTRC